MRTVLLLLLLCLHGSYSFSQAPLSAPEICDNGLDDDTDGLIDCYDTGDCPCNSNHGCTIENSKMPLELDAFWAGIANLNPITTPIVGNLNPWADSIPEIIMSSGNVTNGLYIFKGDGSNQNNPDFLDLGPNLYYHGLISAIADIDRNGMPEVFTVCADKKIRVYTNYTPGANPPMELWATSIDTCQSARFYAYTADFDADGIPEIYAGNEVFGFDLSTPGAPVLKRLAKGTGPIGEVEFYYDSTIAADLLDPSDCNGDPDCNGLEIAAGYGIYSVDIDPNDGDGMQIKLQRNINTTSGQNFSDGFTGVADLNQDGITEVIVPGVRNLEVGVYVWNKTGFWRFFPMDVTLHTLAPKHFGPCSVGNVFDDRTQGYAEDWPEILVRYGTTMRCFNLHAAVATPGTPYWWSNTTLLYDESTGHGAMTSYDFDNNGLSEVVVLDEHNLFILYGGSAPFPPGVGFDRVITSYPASGITGLDIPVVADVDGNGNPEILVNDIFIVQGVTRLLVIHPKNPDYSRWLPARNIWNQYAYHVVNINDDLTVPIVQQPGHVEMPVPGSGKRPLNNFLAQVPAYRYPDATPYFPSADLTVEATSVICQLPTFQVTLEICNKGDRPTADTTKVRFYRAGDPFVSPFSNSIGTFTVSTQPIPPDSCITFNCLLPVASGNIYAVVNDWGKYSTPLPGSDSAFYRPECDLQNNVDIFKMELTNGLPLTVGPDLTVCSGDAVSLTASPGFTSYLWQNGATAAAILVSQPGTYWVEAKDLCFNTKRDTMVIFAGDEFQTIETTLCEGQFFNFQGQDIPAGTTQSFVYTNAVGCDSTIFVKVNAWPRDTTQEFRQVCDGDSTLIFGAYVSAAGQYVQSFLNLNGCDSTHTVELVLLPAPTPSTEIRQICPGDSTLVFGNFVKTAGLYTQHYSSANGCDSTHTITVTFLPAPIPSNETRQICAGDSTLVFGTYVSTAGVFSQNYSNANGCDSTHSVTVSLFPAPVPSNETRQICPGDSTLVFGSFVKTAGQFTQNFSNANGCDSTHSVTVSLFPAPVPSNETRQICPGDSTFVFGSFVKTPGLFTQNFSNANGCDSTHSVTVSLFPAPVPSNETRQICPGDSTLVFGSFIKTAGQFTQNFSNANGCDSTHTVTVSLFPAVVPSNETRQICPGDSTLVFGSFIKTAGQFTQNFSNANGCDSTHTVTVSLFPEVVPSNETRQICAGDSTLVFGNYVSTAGVFSQQFSNTNGCDSTHTITVSLFPEVVPSSETRQICPGDSTLVFGSFVKTAGLFTQNFSNTNGCDSTHSVTVSLFQAPVPSSETRQICPGDSTLVFGSFVKTAGLFTQNFSNANGCDSTHSVTVSLFPAPVPSNETRQICAGDSTLVFGNFVTTSGLFTQNFSNINGCDSMHTVQVLEVSTIELLDSVALCPGDSVLIFGDWVLAPGLVQELLPGLVGCDTLWTIEVQGIDIPLINLQVTQPDALNSAGKIEVQAAAGALYSLNGTPFSGQTIFDGLEPGNYVLQQEFEGCLSEIPVEIMPFFEEPSEGVFVPNIFAPGSANGNAQFTIYASAGHVDRVAWLRIYDRWGSLVFENTGFAPNDESKGWDGFVGGQAAAPGVYFWQAMLEFSNGERQLKKGDLTVIR